MVFGLAQTQREDKAWRSRSASRSRFTPTGSLSGWEECGLLMNISYCFRRRAFLNSRYLLCVWHVVSASKSLDTTDNEVEFGRPVHEQRWKCVTFYTPSVVVDLVFRDDKAVHLQTQSSCDPTS